ncbi:MAG: hypothetical protein COB04_00505 [Gammaproteobacteria bacterium]|nr:MAG: hypothetical protein COB04_00505 [Gammaproteobacteria bacterium]
MDFNKARTFVEVVDRGGITAAASRLKRTQQAISAQINHLEEHLGVDLLVRQGPNIILTADGETLYREFKTHLSSIEAAVQGLKEDKSKASGVIRIGAWQEVSTYYLPEVIKGFTDKYPLVDFEIITATDEALEPLLLDNTIDFSFQVFTQRNRLLKNDPALYETFHPVVSKAYAEKHGLPQSVEDTLHMPIVDYTQKYSQYFHWVRKNRPNIASDAQKKPPLVQVSNNIVLKQLVCQGLGLGFLLQSSIQQEVESGELIILSFPEQAEPNWAEIDIVRKRQNNFGFIHQEFIQYVFDHRIIPSIQENAYAHRRAKPNC